MLAFLLAPLFACFAFAERSNQIIDANQRLVVLTDIGAEVDDQESMVRLLLYSDVIDIEGLIATTSVWKRESTSPQLINAALDAYSVAHANLILHDPHYPSATSLRATVKSGLPVYGMGGVGDGKDSTGSDWLIRCLERNDPRPLWVAVWGGANALAQSLYKLKATKSTPELDRLIAKLRVYTISDQDDSGPWIRENFPKLFYIVSPGGKYSTATWTGINTVVPEIDNSTISNKWLAEHIQQGHGPLGVLYPDVAYGMEGDTPSWLNLIPNGLNIPEHPDLGGWGGRYEFYKPTIPVSDPKTFVAGVPIPQETRPIWTNAVDEYRPIENREFGRSESQKEQPVSDFKATIFRWRNDFQNDFAARMLWATKPYKQANHPPVPLLEMPANLTAHSGDWVQLKARATDPDGDSLSFFWFDYPEAGSYRKPLKWDAAQNMEQSGFIAPKVQKPETVQLIFRVTDKGSPELTRYRRVLVTILP